MEATLSFLLMLRKYIKAKQKLRNKRLCTVFNISLSSQNEAIKLMPNSDFTEKSGTL